MVGLVIVVSDSESYRSTVWVVYYIQYLDARSVNILMSLRTKLSSVRNYKMSIDSQ